ncbi:MAG: hypothetical protein AAGD00_04655 [Planctomycetota bacterium]
MPSRTLAVALTSLALLSPVALTGCEGGGMMGIGQDQKSAAMAALPLEVRQKAVTYMESLSQASSALAGVQGYGDLLPLIRTLDPLITDATNAAEALGALPPDTRENVTKAFGEQMKGINQTFRDQIARVAERFTLPSRVDEMLAGLEMFGG